MIDEIGKMLFYEFFVSTSPVEYKEPLLPPLPGLQAVP